MINDQMPGGVARLRRQYMAASRPRKLPTTMIARGAKFRLANESSTGLGSPVSRKRCELPDALADETQNVVDELRLQVFGSHDRLARNCLWDV